MQRTAIVVTVAAATLLMGIPGQVAAHESTATDLNALAYDNVWQVLGPGGTTDELGVNDALDQVELNAEKKGGNVDTDSCTHDFDGKTFADPDEDGDLEHPPADNTCPEANKADDGATDVHSMTFFECEGSESFSQPLEEADLSFHTPMAFKHNDLENGIFEATGSFFVPIELSGEDASEVTQVYFGFAHTFAWPFSSSLCQQPFPAPGGYYEFYRAGNPYQCDADGCTWEIPVNTLLVPDAPYGAVLRAMDSSGNTLGATFVYSNVNNYLNDADFQPGTPTACDQTGTGDTLCPYHDTTPPYASVFIGEDDLPREDETDNLDGTSDNPAEGQVGGACTGSGVAIEYGEPLAEEGGSLAFEVVDASPSYFPYNPPDRDVDSVPIETTSRDNWGPGICIPQPPSGEFTIRAWDQSGNVGTQTITVS